jgi:tellurite resistance protein TehA-like permease
MRPPSSPFSLALWNFSSQWFLLPQGTGTVALILNRLGYQFQGLRIIAEIVWIYTIVLLGICLFFYLLRVMVFPKHVVHELRTNILETSCLASICIAFTTIIQMIAVQFGASAGLAAYVLWWINAATAILALLGIPYVQLKLQPPGIQNVPPTILLPFIAALTSAAGGGTVCLFGGLSARLQVPVIIVSYLELGVGLASALSLDGVIFSQHYNRNTPGQDKVYQDMILCGPFGQGSFALQALGRAVMAGSFAEYNRGTFLTAEAATPIGYASHFAGLLSWGYGTFWWCFAIISILQTLLGQEGGWRRIGFQMSAWAVIFPWVGCLFVWSEGARLIDSRACIPMPPSSSARSWTRPRSGSGRPSFCCCCWSSGSRTRSLRSKALLPAVFSGWTVGGDGGILLRTGLRMDGSGRDVAAGCCIRSRPYAVKATLNRI